MSEIVESTLKTAGPNGVVLFSKTSPYCRCSSKVKDELASTGISPMVVEVDQHPDGQENQTALIQTTGQEQTVSSAVWVDGTKRIGGTSVNVPRGVFRENAKMRAVRQHAEMAGLRHWYLIA